MSEFYLYVASGAILLNVVLMMRWIMASINDEMSAQVGGQDSLGGWTADIKPTYLHDTRPPPTREPSGGMSHGDPYRTPEKPVEPKHVLTLGQQALQHANNYHTVQAYTYAMADIADALRDVAAAIKEKK